MSEKIQGSPNPLITDHEKEARTDVSAPSMLNAATSTLGAAALQRKIARRHVQRKEGGDAAGTLAESGNSGGGSLGSLQDVLRQMATQTGREPESMAKGRAVEERAVTQKGRAEMQAEQAPSNKLVPVNERDSHMVSDAVVGNLDSAVKQVNSLTGVDIGKGFGDTTRNLGQGTKKVGADNFSWHKSGRAVDFNQGLKWVIAKNPSGKDMYFRLYLEANEEGGKSRYAKTFTKEEVSSLSHNGMGANITKKAVVDVTAILEENGFERIPAQSGWADSYNKQEWWHYVKSDGLTWYQALHQLYTDAEIVSAMKKLVVDRHGHGGRLGRREGFPGATLKAIWDNKPVTKGKLSLFFSVGNNESCVNLPEDVEAVKTALTGLGITPKADVAAMISAYQEKKGGKGDGYMTVGGATHSRIGAEMK